MRLIERIVFTAMVLALAYFLAVVIGGKQQGHQGAPACAQRGRL